MDSVEKKLGPFSNSSSAELESLTELRACPHIPRTPELIKFAETAWPMLRTATGNLVGFAVEAESGCWLETPEGFDFAKNGDYLIYVVRSRTFWVISKLFAQSLGWTVKDRQENRQANQRDTFSRENGNLLGQEVMFELPNEDG